MWRCHLVVMVWGYIVDWRQKERHGFCFTEHSKLIVAASSSKLPSMPLPLVAIWGVIWQFKSKEKPAEMSVSRKLRSPKLVRHSSILLALSEEAIEELQDPEMSGGGASIARLRVGQ